MFLSIFRTALACAVLAGYLTGAFISFAPLVEYYLNYDYIVKELCVEREEEDNCCKGSCHLKVEIEEQQQQEEQTPALPIIQTVKEQSPHLPASVTIYVIPHLYFAVYAKTIYPIFKIALPVLTPPPKL